MYLNIPESGYLGIRIMGYPDITVLKYSGIRIFWYPDILVSGYPLLGYSGTGSCIFPDPDIPVSGYSGFNKFRYCKSMIYCPIFML